MAKQRRWNDRPTQQDVVAVFTSTDEWLTRKEIALRLGVSKNAALITLLDQCVVDSVLQMRKTALLNGVEAFEYGLT